LFSCECPDWLLFCHVDLILALLYQHEAHAGVGAALSVLLLCGGLSSLMAMCTSAGAVTQAARSIGLSVV
jgi:hypothetical protein